jgi:hypothetical protein
MYRINYMAATHIMRRTIMEYPSYINLTDDFIKGLSEYISKKGIPLDEVVEVFAGIGALGLQLGLKENCNISDSLLYADVGYEDDVNMNWERKPRDVAVESADETVIRFSAEEGRNIRLLIMGAPLPANSYYCPSYDTIKALHHRFDAKVLYIGEMRSLAFASPKFFRHVEEVEDDLEESFINLVKNNYHHTGYFAGELFDEPVVVQPYLLRFVQCADENNGRFD